METVQCFSIDLSRALDFHEHIKAFTLANKRDHPTDVSATYTVFCVHFTVGALVATAATDVPVGDFEVRRHDIVDVHVLKSGVSVVLEEDQDFVATLSSNRKRLLSSGKVTSIVDDADDRCVLSISSTPWASLFGTEFTVRWCSD